MKTNEELNTLKEEIETLNKKLSKLSEEELSGHRRRIGTGGFHNNVSELR